MEKIEFKIFNNNFSLTLLTVAIFLFFGILSIIFNFSFLFAIAVPFVFLSVILFIKNPLILLALLIIIRMSLDYSSNFIFFQISKDISISFSQFIGISIAFLGFILLIFKRKQLKKFPLWVPFLIVLFWGIATFFYSISPRDSFQEIVRIFGLFTLSALSFVSIQKIEDFRKIILAFFLSSILPICFAVYQLIFQIGFRDNLVSIPRIFGTFSHPNVLSMYLFGIISLAFLYIWTLTDTKKSKILISLFIIINIIVLYLTYTRIAWIALLFFVGAIGIMRFRKLLIPLIFIPIFLLIFSTELQGRVYETFNPSVDSSIVWRKILWEDTVSKTINDGKMLFGYGINTFPIVSESFRGIALGSNDSHNDFVKFFVEGGLVGFAIFILFIFSIIYIIWKQKKSVLTDLRLSLIFEILGVMFLAIIISSLSDNIFKNTPLQWIFWIVLGGSLALAKKQEK